MNDEKYIAQRIKELRKNAGLDVDTVGAGVGRSGKTVSAWETGRNVPSAEMLISICRFFGVGIGYFYPEDIQDPAPARQTEAADPDERELLALWRLMTDKQKARVLDEMRDYALANEKIGDGSRRALEGAGRAALIG